MYVYLYIIYDVIIQVTEAIPTYVIALGKTSEVKPLENGRRDALQKVRSLLNFESDKEYSRYILRYYLKIVPYF